MTPADLARYGAALTCKSEDWRRPLAYLLKVDPRTVRRWANGETPVPESVEAELKRLAAERRNELETLETLR